VQDPDEKQQRELLFMMKSLRESLPDEPLERMWGKGPAVLRGKLVKTGEGSTFFTKERKRRQTGTWVLEARLDSATVWVPLVGVAADDKLLDAAEELAGKEVLLTGKTVIVTAYLQLRGSSKYSAVSVESLKAAEHPARPATEKQANAPPEYLKWYVWYMKYRKGQTWVYVAGYHNPDESVYYRWKGVSLQAEQVPGIDRLTHRTPVYDLAKLKGLKPVEIDPPVRYWLLKSGRYAVGYYDPGEWTFFRWRGITLGSDEILPDAPGYPARIVPAPKKDLDGQPFTRDKENDYLLTIDPPAHLLQQPTSWKKTPQPKKEADGEPTSFRVEVRGVLRVSGKLRKINELESPPNINSPAHAIDNKSVATGATLETRQMGAMEVYFGGDEKLHKQAKRLSGKAVRLFGSLERVTFYSKQDKDRFPLLYGGGGGVTQEFWTERPALITKTYIRVTRLEAAEQPRPEAKSSTEPNRGESSAEKVAKSDSKEEDVFDHQRFCVTIWPERTRVLKGDPFKVKLRVVNSSGQVQSFKAWSCSWQKHWKSSNPRIDFSPWHCWDNARVPVQLQPGGGYEQEWWMTYEQPWWTIRLKKGPSTTVSFRTGFTPGGEKTTYWSNEVVLGVIPEPEEGQEKNTKATPNPDDKQQSPEPARAKVVELILNWLRGGKAGGAFERDFGDSH
jgi:hypothetical protein